MKFGSWQTCLLAAAFIFGSLVTGRAAGPYGYVVNNGSASLTVVDMGANPPSVISPVITTNSQPSELLIQADNRYALLTEYGSGTVRKLDLWADAANATVGSPLGVGTGPGSIASSGDGNVWVANEGSNDVSVIRVSDMSIVDSIAVGTTPVQVNRSGKFIYVVNRDSASITVIASDTRQVVSTVALDSNAKPNQFALYPKGGVAYITDPVGGRVYVFDLASNSVTKTLSSGGAAIVTFGPAPAQSGVWRMYVLKRASTTTGAIDAYNLNDPANPTLAGSITGLAANPSDMAITSDGLYAYIACAGSTAPNLGAVYSADLKLLSADPIPYQRGNIRPIADTVLGVSFDPNENHVYAVLAGTGQVAVFDTNTDSVVTNLPAGTSPTALVQLNQPYVPPGAVLNGASFALNQPVAGGAIVSIFGEGLVTRGGQSTQLPLATSIAGTTVKFNGTLAPLFFTSGTQINAVVPSALIGSASATLEVAGPNGSDVSTIALAPVASPGLFALNSAGFGTGIIQRFVVDTQTYLLVTPDSPAHPDDIIVLWASGLGQTNPAIVDGQATTVLAPVVNACTVAVGPQTLTPLYAGLAPCCAGVYQINAKLPAQLAPGTYDVTVSVNGIKSNVVTMAVQ